MCLCLVWRDAIETAFTSGSGDHIFFGILIDPFRGVLTPPASIRRLIRATVRLAAGCSSNGSRKNSVKMAGSLQTNPKVTTNTSFSYRMLSATTLEYYPTAPFTQNRLSRERVAPERAKVATLRAGLWTLCRERQGGP